MTSVFTNTTGQSVFLPSVGDDADDAVVAHGEQREENGGEDRAGGQRVLPQVEVLETHDELQGKEIMSTN